VVAFRSAKRRPVRSRPASQNADAGVLAVFADGVIRAQILSLAAKAARGLSAEIIAQGEENLSAKRLEQTAPRLSRKRRAKRADRLGRDDGDAFRLARERKEFLVAGRIALPHCGEALVFVTKKQDFPKVACRLPRHLRDAVQHGALEILFH